MAVHSYPYASTVCIATAPQGYARRCSKGLSTVDEIVMFVSSAPSRLLGEFMHEYITE